MLEVQDHVDDLDRALGAQRDVGIDDVVEIVLEMADFLFSVALERLRDPKIAAFDKDLHCAETSPLSGRKNAGPAKRIVAPNAAACGLCCVARRRRPAQAARAPQGTRSPPARR